MRYHWQSPDSLIKDIEFYAPHQEQEALIYAPEGADARKLTAIAEAMRFHGFAAEPDIVDNSYVLRVSRFLNRDAVLNVLNAEHAISGEPAKEKTKFDVKQPYRFDGKQLGAMLQVGADLAIIPAALGRGAAGVHDALASLQWIGAYGILAAFGQKNPDKQTQYIFQDVRKHLRQAGFEFTAEDAAMLSAYAGREGTFSKIEQFIREHPVEINSFIQMTGGMSNVSAGWTQVDYNNHKNWWKIAAGATTFTGNLTGGVLGSTFQHHPEKHDVMRPDGSVVQETVPEDEKPQGMLDTVLHWIREKPLRITGTLGVVSNILRITSGKTEGNKYKAFMGMKADGTVGHGESNGIYRERDIALRGEIGAFKEKCTAAGLSHSSADGLEESLKLEREYIHQKASNPPSILSFFGFGKKPPPLPKPLAAFTGNEQEMEAQMHAEYNVLHKKEQRLLSTYDKIAHTRVAANRDYIANAVKMVANALIASSSSKIDADLKQTGHLDEICNFMAHLAHGHTGDREAVVYNLSSLLSGQQGIEASQKELAGIINKKLAAIENNPWEKSADLAAAPLLPEMQKEPLPDMAAMTPAPKVTDVSAHIPPQPQVSYPAHVA